MKNWEKEFDEKFGDFNGITIAHKTMVSLKASDVKSFIQNLLSQSRKEWDEKWRETIRNKKWYKEIANDLDTNFIVKDEAVLKAEMGWEKLMSEKVKKTRKDVLEEVMGDVKKIRGIDDSGATEFVKMVMIKSLNMRMDVEKKKDELKKAEEMIEMTEKFVSGEMSKQLTTPEFSEMSQSEFQERKSLL
jgi:hypothetical protein